MKRQRRGGKKPRQSSFDGRKKEAPIASKSRNSKNAGRKNGNQSKRGSDGGVIMDDIVAQLQRQRQKRQSVDERAATAGNPTKKGPLPSYPEVKHHAGNFQYDATTKKYFPKSTFKSHGNNDVCIQRIQKHMVANDIDARSNEHDALLLVNEQTFQLRSNVTDEDVRKVIFRGTCLRRRHGEALPPPPMESKSKKRDKQRNNTAIRSHNTKRPLRIPCTERTTLLLTTSLEYCTNATRRNIIASMVGPSSVARGARVVPTQSTLEMIQNGTKDYMDSYIGVEDSEYDEPIRPFALAPLQQSGMQHAWFSILHPLKSPRDSQIQNQQPPWSPTIPYDCKCKSYLQPSVPTFDILPGYRDRSSVALPHIATISNDAVYYRSRSPCGVRGYSAWELKSVSKSVHHRGVRFASYCATERSFSGGIQDDALVGCVTYDFREIENNFTLQKTGNATNQESREIEIYPLASPVNDFSFTPDSTLQDPGQAAFAHGGDAKIGASFLDISTGTYSSIRDNWSHSEPLCLQHRDKNKILFGHRDGCVSLLDTRSGSRSGSALFATSMILPGVSFGSATSIQSFQKEDNVVAVKGSFGSCRVFDLRRLSNNSHVSSQYQQSTLLELSIPDSMVHQTKSVRCTGLAIDPNESIIVAPFAGHNSDVLFAMWDIHTGALLRMLNLNSINKHTSSDTNTNNGLAVFCELSSVVTSGCEMICKKTTSDTPIICSGGSSWGLWYKTNVLSGSTPPDGGGVHHIRF